MGDGPLKVSDQSEPRAISHAFVEAFGALQIRETQDFNGPEQEGAGLYQVKQFGDVPKKGERCLTNFAYVALHRQGPNLIVVTKALAEKVLIEDGRATGLSYRSGGQRVDLRARREVILSAGIPTRR